MVKSSSIERVPLLTHVSSTSSRATIDGCIARDGAMEDVEHGGIATTIATPRSRYNTVVSSWWTTWLVLGSVAAVGAMSLGAIATDRRGYGSTALGGKNPANGVRISRESDMRRGREYGGLGDQMALDEFQEAKAVDVDATPDSKIESLVRSAIARVRGVSEDEVVLDRDSFRDTRELPPLEVDERNYIEARDQSHPEAQTGKPQEIEKNDDDTTRLENSKPREGKEKQHKATVKPNASSSSGRGSSAAERQAQRKEQALRQERRIEARQAKTAVSSKAAVGQGSKENHMDTKSAKLASDNLNDPGSLNNLNNLDNLIQDSGMTSDQINQAINIMQTELQIQQGEEENAEEKQDELEEKADEQLDMQQEKADELNDNQVEKQEDRMEELSDAQSDKQEDKEYENAIARLESDLEKEGGPSSEYLDSLRARIGELETLYEAAKADAAAAKADADAALANDASNDNATASTDDVSEDLIQTLKDRIAELEAQSAANDSADDASEQLIQSLRDRVAELETQSANDSAANTADRLQEEQMLKNRIAELEAALDKALNGHVFNSAFFRKRPVGLEPNFQPKDPWDESGAFYQCAEEETCMTGVTLYKRNGKLYGMKGLCERGGKATDLGTGLHDLFPKHSTLNFTDDVNAACTVPFADNMTSVFIRRELDDVIAMSTDGTQATRCGKDVPTATSVKFVCPNPKACINGYHVKNRFDSTIDGTTIQRTEEDLSVSEVDFVCSDGNYAVDPLTLRDDYGQVTVTPEFTVGVAHTPTLSGIQRTVTPYLSLKTHSVVSAAVHQVFLMVVQIRDITHLSENLKKGWCTQQTVQARLNSKPTCRVGSKLCAKPGFLYNPQGSEYELRFGTQRFNISSANTHESSHIVFTNNLDADLAGHLPVKVGEEYFKFGHTYEVCASAVDYSGFETNITDTNGAVVGSFPNRRLDGDALFVGLSKVGERSVSMEGGPRHYYVNAPSNPTPQELDDLGCGNDSCVISSGAADIIGYSVAANSATPTSAATASVGGFEVKTPSFDTSGTIPTAPIDPMSALSPFEREAIRTKQLAGAISARERLEQKLAARGVDLDLTLHTDHEKTPTNDGTIGGN